MPQTQGKPDEIWVCQNILESFLCLDQDLGDSDASPECCVFAGECTTKAWIMPQVEVYKLACVQIPHRETIQKVMYLSGETRHALMMLTDIVSRFAGLQSLRCPFSISSTQSKVTNSGIPGFHCC